ncbi:ABC transporter permease subunit [Kibdelosporangium aridum]|uniref:ABC transporter permease subunit n=1 Tax=Kibdelosporangium aridum TaxID=2030 RepID=UPI00055E7155|nr:ABC transporter permease subunit [Kibdelosporangium aridum]
MIWVTWRQQRLQIFAVVGIVAALSLVLVYLRSQAVNGALSDTNQLIVSYILLLLVVLPVLLGMFFGAPLFAREIEQGTHVFALTQSVSRTRWLITKAAMACGSLAVAMFVLGVVAAWAFEPMKSTMQTRLETGQFEAQGVVVGGYAILAFAVGATAGLVLRNTLAAMVVTLIMYGAVLLTLGQSVRENYAEPSYFEAPVNQVASQAEPGRSWQVDYGFVDATGKQFPLLSTRYCAAEPNVRACFDRMNFVASYSKAHLPNQFWRFQFTELGLVLALSALVLGAGVGVSRRPLA